MTDTTGRGGLIGAPAELTRDSERMILGVPVTTIKRPDRLVFVLPLVGAAVGTATGAGAIFQNGVDKASVPVLGILGLLLLVPLVYLRTSLGTIDRAALALVGLCLAGAVLLLLLPEWIYGFQINGIIHHSVFSAPRRVDRTSLCTRGSDSRSFSPSPPTPCFLATSLSPAWAG